MSQDIAARLRAQADAFEAQAKQATPVPAGFTPADIPRLVREEMNRIVQQALPPEAVAKLTEPPPILALMGQAYTEPQQMWISANTKSIPDFIKSSNGKAALGMLLEEFQAFMKLKENAPN